MDFLWTLFSSNIFCLRISRLWRSLENRLKRVQDSRYNFYPRLPSFKQLVPTQQNSFRHLIYLPGYLIFVNKTFLLRAGEGRRPWATTSSPSVPHISFLSSGSHEPPLFPLSYHHIWIFWAKCDFQKSSHVTQYIYLNLYIHR